MRRREFIILPGAGAAAWPLAVWAQQPAMPVIESQSESLEHIPTSEQHVFPPFDKQTFPSQLVWLALTFAALYLLMSRIALPRIGSILEERRKQIENDLADAQRAKGESDAAVAAHEQALAEARGRGQILGNEIRAKAAAAAEARRNEVDAQLAIRISEAEKAVTAARSSAMANVHEMAGDAAGEIVERLTGVVPTKQDLADAIATVVKRGEGDG